MKNKKPPLGLRPRNMGEQVNIFDRKDEIKNAISRYVESDKMVPTEWLNEYNDICHQILDASKIEEPSIVKMLRDIEGIFLKYGIKY